MISSAKKGALIDTSSGLSEEANLVDTSRILPEDRPISKHKLYGPGRFWGMYASEHVAATEFVIGATFVAWGVGMRDVIIGLFLGNILAVCAWMFVCAPIAVDTRLTLYSYLKKIAGPQMQRIANFVNVIFFSIIAAAMITITASAVRELFGIPIQLKVYPTSIAFIILVMVIGMIIAIIAAYGFEILSYISSVCGPWLITLFTVAGIVSIPILASASSEIESARTFSDILRIGNEYVWISNPDSPMTIWHIIAFTWGPLGHHLALSDMTFFRYGKKNYGYTTSIGMFFGHFLAWLFAGLLGMAAATILNTEIGLLDPGAVAFSVFGITGSIAVVLAGVTTTYPKLYRIGSAFQTIYPKWSVKKIILVSGFFISIIASFPFAFSYILEVVAFLGTVILPIGLIVATEHFIFPKIGYTRYWSSYKNLKLNKAALYTWILAVATATILTVFDIMHVNFQAIPVSLVTIIGYIVLAGKSGAKESYPEEEEQDRFLQEQVIKEVDEAALKEIRGNANTEGKKSSLVITSGILAVASLAGFLGSAILVFTESIDLEVFQSVALITTLTYFIFAVFFSKDMRNT